MAIEICFVTFDCFMPVKSGMDEVALRLSEGLSRAGNIVHSVSYRVHAINDSVTQPGFDRALLHRIIRKARSVVGRLPLVRETGWLLEANTSPRFFIKLMKLINQPSVDLVHVEGFPILPISIFASFLSGKPLVVHMQEVNSAFDMPWSRATKALARLSEYLSGFLASAIVVSTSVERSILVKLGAPQNKIYVLRHGVDCMKYDNIEGKEARRSLNLQEGIYIIFVGDFNWPPNRIAAEKLAEQIAPLINPLYPSVKFLLVGRNPPKGPRQKNVIRTGWVKDIAPYVMAADIAVAPIEKGGGTFTKVLEYVAAGKPTIISPLVARNLGLRNAEHVLVARTNEDFVKAIISLLSDKERCEILATNGRRFVRQLFNWEAIVSELVQIYKNVLKS